MQRNAKPPGEFVNGLEGVGACIPDSTETSSVLEHLLSQVTEPPPSPLPSPEAAATDEPCHLAFTEGVCVQMRNGAQ